MLYNIFMERLLIYTALLIAVLAGAVFLDWQAAHSAYYVGLTTVPCIDTTRPISESFKFNLNIQIEGKQNLLDKKIGYDYGKCLHEIFTNDNNGLVYVKQNDSNTYNLGNFFDVWHKTFNDNQIFNYKVESGHLLKVFVNGKRINSNFRDVLLKPNEQIEIVFD